ncbi:DUF4440 domain-containing protein [Roseiterribacter gracilis]|uniref:nuclear transport factor 2 family protein n=1 Tax=Roseiterribacter gracilis TaxID=2812848 RepID=UPI003B432135
MDLLAARDPVLAGTNKEIAPAVWTRLLDDDAIYTDENGKRFSKNEMVATIKPLPTGVTGNLGPVDLRVRRHGDSAVVTYDIDEHEDYHGARLHALYRVTDSWVRRKQGWRLVAGQVLAVPHDPPAVTLPATQLDDYVGSYALGGTERYVITRDGDGIAGSRNGGAAKKIACELRDVFFTPGSPRSRKIFQRDANGRVTGFVDRREGEDVVWVRRG